MRMVPDSGLSPYRQLFENQRRVAVPLTLNDGGDHGKGNAEGGTRKEEGNRDAKESSTSQGSEEEVADRVSR